MGKGVQRTAAGVDEREQALGGVRRRSEGAFHVRHGLFVADDQ